MDGPDLPGRLRWLAPITIGLLLLLTVGAFGLSQRLKREPLVIDRVSFAARGADEEDPKRNVFSPNGDCRRDLMVIGFRTTKSDTADVDIIGTDGTLVRRLAVDRFFKRYREHELVWDGRDDSGQVPPTGPYKVRVKMKGLDRELDLPGRIRLHNFPPRDSNCGGPSGGLSPATRSGPTGDEGGTGPSGDDG